MHKFQPRIYLVMRAAGETGPVTDIEKERYRTFVFPETQFTTVTAYQNQLVSFTPKSLETQISPPPLIISLNSDS